MRLAIASVLIAVAGLACSAAALADVKAGVDDWQRGQYDKAVAEWKPLAIRGDADAQFNMGQAYKLGRGVQPDLKLAQDWYKKAADQGHEQAQANLGLILFQNGDRQTAMPYLKKAAERGEPRAQYVYGTALFNADLVQKDWPRAYAYMTRANAAGLPQAAGTLAQMDQYIPAVDRQQGAALAASWEQQQKLAAINAQPAPNAPPPQLYAQNTPSASPPPSGPGYPSDDEDNTPPPRAPAPARPAPPRPASAPVRPLVARPAPVEGAVASAGGRWRVQLGAYSDGAAARGVWTKLAQRHASLGGLQPYIVKAGAVNRLQGGPLATKAAAEKVCAGLAAAGQACFAVAP